MTAHEGNGMSAETVATMIMSRSSALVAAIASA